MSLFDSASLIVTPSAYKAGKLYSLKPTDGAGDLSVTRATTATRVNSNGLIESVASGVPRIDYTNGSCPSILVEPQRTNLLLRSEEFDNVAWSKENSTITSNSIISPDGTLTADKLVESANVNFHRISFVASVSNTTYSVSIFAKKLERDYLVIRTNISGTNVNTCFDLNNGSVVYNGHLYSSIVDYGGGWYRCVITQTSTITTTRTIGFLISDTEVTNNTIPSYLGDGTSGLYIWGAQLEVGANATSYIPTTSATVTRNADVISKTGISDLIGQTEGTVFIDAKTFINPVDFSSLRRCYLILTDGTFSNRIEISKFGSNILTQNNDIKVRISSGGTTIFDQTVVTNYSGDLKLALAYKSGSTIVYINGINVYEYNTAYTVPATSFLNLGNGYNQPTTDSLNYALLWKTRLSNTELATLTSI